MNSWLIPLLLITSTVSVLDLGGSSKSAVDIAKLLFLGSALLILAAALAGRGRDSGDLQSHTRKFIPRHMRLIPKLVLVIALLILG